MKKLLLVLILLVFAPICVSARTAIDPYGNEYEVYDEKPSGFSEDNIASEHNVTSYAPIVTTTKKSDEEKQKEQEEKKAKAKERKVIAYGIIGIVVIFVLIVIFIFLIRALRASNMY